jgi:two-component system NtrC family sensor kinase
VPSKTSEIQVPSTGGVRFRLALKLSALVALTIVTSWLVVDWIIRTRYQQDQILTFILATGAGGIVFAAMLDVLVTRPVLRLVAQVRRATGRNWEKPIAVQGQDEIAELGRSLEALRCSVVAQREELEGWNAQLEERVKERTRQLETARDQLVQSEKLAGLGQLAAGVAHEVNNPTGIILSRAGYLLSVADEEGLDPDVIDDLQVIEHQARRIASIVGDLLQFGRPTSSGRASVVLGEVLELTASVLRHTAERAGLTLAVEVIDRAPVLADRDRLEQVAFNLLKNAIDATPRGGRVTARADGGRLVVEDTGEGIDEDDLPRIFDPFFTTKEVGKGSGLGLAITYGIVSEHGGTITASSQKGEGTTMVVKLPLAAPPAGDPEQEIPP